MRDKESAFWASLADALPTIRERHPSVADQFCVALQRGDRDLHISAAAHCREQLIASGFDCPEWGTSSGVCDQCSFQLTTPCLGSARGGNAHRCCVAAIAPPRAGTPRLPKSPDGMRTVQLHPIVQCDSVRTPGVPCVAPQTSLVPSPPVRVKLPVWPSTRSKWPPPRSLSARRSFGAKGVPLGERRSTRLQRGRRVSDYERPSPGSGPASQNRSRQSPFRSGGRWTPLFHGAQFAIETTMVSPVRMDGSPRRQCATTDVAAMAQARVRKERTNPELAQGHGRARLVVVACEVGGRWSDEALSFLNSLANAEVRDKPEHFKKIVKASWLRRWKALLACAHCCK